MCPLPESTEHSDNNIAEQRPLLVTLSARALSSVGFGLSIIALSIQWLLQNQERGRNQLIDYGRLLVRSDEVTTRRRSLPPYYSATMRRTSRESRLRVHAKRVSFESGTQGHTEVVQVMPTQGVKTVPPVIHISAWDSVSRPLSSVTTAPPTRRNSPEPIANSVVTASDEPPASPPTLEEKSSSGIDAQSSAPPPLAPQSPRTFSWNIKTYIRAETMRKSDGFFVRCPRRKDKTESSGRDSATPSSTPSPTRPFIRRKLCPKFRSKESSPEASPKRCQSPRLSIRNKCRDRRRSVPVPRARTMPYEAPYFATPPGPISDASNEKQ